MHGIHTIARARDVPECMEEQRLMLRWRQLRGGRSVQYVRHEGAAAMPHEPERTSSLSCLTCCATERA